MSFIPDGYCDFRGCFNLIGEARFGEDWTGRELGARPIPSPEERDREVGSWIERLEKHQPDDLPIDREDFFRLLGKKAALGRDAEGLTVSFSDDHLFFGEIVREWEAIDPKKDEYKNLYSELCEFLVRKNDVLSEIRQNLYNGRIRAYLLDSYGHLEGVPKDVWATSVWDSVASGLETTFPMDKFWSSDLNALVSQRHKGLALFMIEDIEKLISGSELPATAAAKTRCKEWLKDMMTSGPKPKPKGTFRGEAKDKFGVGRGYLMMLGDMHSKKRTIRTNGTSRVLQKNRSTKAPY